MPKQSKDIIGQKFNMLTVVGVANNQPSTKNGTYFLCHCDCGNIKEVPKYYLTSDQVKSCGCLRRRVSLIGNTYNYLTVVGHAPNDKNNSPQWRCRCKCGNETIVRSFSLKDGSTKSCGCIAFNDLTGKVFNRLLVLKVSNRETGGAIRWLCRCACGNLTRVRASRLYSNEIRSCGCLAKELSSERNSTHSMSKSREYKTWIGMRRRCYDPSMDSFRYYGGKGITVCPRWMNSFEKFYEDMGPANGLTIDRVDSNKDYSPENCRWVDNYTQSANRSLGKNTTTGVRHVSLCANDRFRVGFKRYHVCQVDEYFDNLKEAAQFAHEAVEEYNDWQAEQDIENGKLFEEWGF